MEKTIRLKENDILKIAIEETDGTPTGEYLTFDLEDIELPIKLSECELKHRNNCNWIAMQMSVISKKQDKKGKKLISSNEEEQIKAMKEFYQKEEEALDLFLGKGGVKKLMHGRSYYYSMYDDIVEMLEPVIPMLEKSFESIANKIKKKYKMDDEKEL